MKSSLTLVLGCASVIACGGGNAQSDDGDSMAGGSAAGNVELKGQFEIKGTAPYVRGMADSELRCQRATPGSPFRAQWEDQASSLAILVTGFPQAGSNDYRVDMFQVVHFLPGGQEQARLSGATLTVQEQSRSGAMATYGVEATGTFANGGTFHATGTCQA